MEKALSVLTNDKSKASTGEELSIEEMIGDHSDDDLFIHGKLNELESRCEEINRTNPCKDTDYAIKVIRKICNEVSELKLSIVINRPFPGWLAYDGQLLRNIESIVLKIDLVSDKYFPGLYKKYTFINSHNSCNSKEKVHELVDEWLSDRRAMVEVVSAMLDEIQCLGITPKPAPPKESGIGGLLPDILGALLPGKGF